MAREDIKRKRQEKISHILLKATESFAEKGYSGVTTNEIADAAAISKRSMYYYMGDKDTLYSSVIDEILAGGNKYFESCQNNRYQLSTIDKLYDFIAAVSRIGKTQKIHSIVLRELLAGGGFLPKGATTQALGQLCDIADNIINEGVRKNEFKQMNPMLLTILVLSFFVYWKINMVHIDPDSKYSEFIDEYGVDISDELVSEVHHMVLELLTCNGGKRWTADKTTTSASLFLEGVMVQSVVAEQTE